MTEEEAKTKFCPMARAMTLGIDNTPTTNGSKNFSCIASVCMMWRWKTKSVLFDPKTKEMAPSVFGQSYDGSKFIHMEVDDCENGFCGLAGKP